MRQTKTERYTVTPLALRPIAEREAIERYCASAHPSNTPKNLDAAAWAFDRQRDGTLTACLLLGRGI